MYPRERSELVFIVPFGQREYENYESYNIQEKRDQIVVFNHIAYDFKGPQVEQLILQLSYIKIINTEKEEIPG